MTVYAGEKFKQTVETKIKQPYTWKMTYKGSEIKGSIGKSGLAWDPVKATITGTAADVGSYDVTVWLDNEASVTSESYTINIIPKTLKLVTPSDQTARAVLTEAKHGEQYTYQAKAEGSGPFTWSLEDVPGNWKWTGYGWSDHDTDWIAVDSSTGLIKADKVYAFGWGCFHLDNSHTAYDFTLVVKDNYGQEIKLPVRLPVRYANADAAPKFREDKRYVNAKYSSGGYSFNVPVAISGYPRDHYSVEWKVEGGEKYGITSENMRHDFYEHYDVNGDYWTESNGYICKNGESTGYRVSSYGSYDGYSFNDDGTYRYYYLEASGLDKEIYSLLSGHKLTLKITADNGTGKATATAEITFPSYETSASATDTTSAPPVVIEDGEEISENAGTDFEIEDGYRIKILNMRGVNNISAKNLAFIPSDYEVIAVLPEISVDESGLYEFDIEISEDVEAGRELKWFAFPQNSEPSEDDEIAEFYDSDGGEVKTLPENHKLTVDVWFNKEKIYEPVISVKK